MDGFHWDYVRAAKVAFDQMDGTRRWHGRLLDSAGFGPIETPYRILHAEAGVRLRAYDEGAQRGPALLIVPAPIKRAYIWDLSPTTSVVQRCLEKGLLVYLAEWTQDGESEQHFGLVEYGDRLLATCLDVIEADSTQPAVILAAHSLGGILATTFACLHPGKVRATLLLETPLHFGTDAGDFAPLMSSTRNARQLGEAFGSVPGSFLSLVSAAAAPGAFQWERHLDWLQSMRDPAAFATHMRVERWTQDEFPMPGKLFADIVERLYRKDQLMQGRLRIGQRHIGPRNVKTPLLNVIDPRSTVIPPESIVPFHDAAASATKKVLLYEGDVGVAIQHVGVLVGAQAHAIVWPAIFDWLEDIGVRH